MKVTVLQHVEHEGPGLVATVAGERGHEVDVVRLDRGDALPDADELQALVVLGGPFAADDDDGHPFLPAERELLAAAVRAGTPVLAVCLGAQLMALALGGSLRRDAVTEVGFGHVELTHEGRADPLLGPAQLRLAVFHWHHDAFVTPPGAVRLASSPEHAEQAFRAGPHAYALQFHVETDATLAEAWREHLPAGVDAAEHRRLVEAEGDGRAVLSRWLVRAAQRAGA